MSATITTVYHNKAGEIVASWEQAESVTYHTICTDEHANAAESKLVALAHEFAEKHYKEIQKENSTPFAELSSRTALTTCRPKYGKLNLNNTTMINATKLRDSPYTTNCLLTRKR